MDSGYRILAVKYIRRQAKQLAEQLDGVCAAEDIEFVHRARVATRRLRAALRMFDDCFAHRRVRRWRKAIRKTTSKLGDARDRDVQIELLCGALSALSTKECLPGIARILVQLERDRERLQRNVVKAVNRLEAQGVLKKMRRVAKRVLRKAGSSADSVQIPAVYDRTQRQVLQQIDELLRYEDSLAHPDDQQRHHVMRIAAKRLRYTLEIARPVYPGRLDEPLDAIKRVQSLLGEVHDCDVWAKHLDAFAAAQRDRITALFGHAGRLVRLQPGIDYLRQNRRRHRAEVFRQLVAYWAELGQRRFWEHLTGAVLARGTSPGGDGATTAPIPAEVGNATATSPPDSNATATSDVAAAAPVPSSSAAATPGLPPEPTKSETRLADEKLGRVWQPPRKPLLTTGS